MIYKESKLSGLITNFQEATWEERQSLIASEIISEQIGEVGTEMVQMPITEYLEDREFDMTIVTTDTGNFVLIAQNIDGHGRQYVLEETQ